MVTIIVPTRNRASFVKRLLGYHAGFEFKYPLLIGDSSDDGQANEIVRAIESLKRKDRVGHFRFGENQGVYEVSHQLLKKVSTSYVVLHADDDFLVPAGIERAAEFLGTHPDYSIALGDAATFGLKDRGAYGEIEWAGRYAPKTVEYPTAKDRLRNYLGFASTAFTVHRTELMVENYRKAVSLELEAGFAEMLTTCLSAIQGCSKKLSGLYMMRQLHADQFASRNGRRKDYFDWITSPEWGGQYQRFRDCLAEDLALSEQISTEAAQEEVKRPFWAYLNRNLISRFAKTYGESSRDSASWRRVARGIPGLRSAWSVLRPFVPGQEPEISLAALLRPSSPYHRDFMPIHRALTAPQLNSRK